MSQAQPPAAPLTTQQIQQKLEDNHQYLVQIVAAQSQQKAPQGLDAATQAKVDDWSTKLQQNLMQLAGQADKSTAAATGQPQAGAAQGVSPQKHSLQRLQRMLLQQQAQKQDTRCRQMLSNARFLGRGMGAQ